MTRNESLLLSGAALAVAGLVVWALWPTAAVVEMGVVTEGAFEQTVDEEARTRIRDHYIVSAPLAGDLERIELKAGDPVREGQTVARLRPMAPALLDERAALELRRRVEAAEAGVESAAARLARARVAQAQAQKDLERSRTLASSGLVAAAKLEADELAAQLAQREVESAGADAHLAGHEVQIAQAALSRSRGGGGASWALSSPISGRILQVQHQSAGAVGLGTPLIEVGNPANLEVVVQLLTSDAARVEAGAAVSLDNWGGERPLAGRVRRIEPWGFTKISALGVEEQRVNVLVDLLSPAADWLRLGEAYRMDAHIRVYHSARALRVSTGALFRAGERWQVYEVDAAGRARLRTVELGQRATNDAEVLGGLSAGARVILYPGDLVRDGVRVTAQQDLP